MSILALWGWFEDGSMALGLPQYCTLHPHVRPDRRWCKCQLLWKKRWRPRENLKSAGRMPNSDAFSMATFNALDAGAHAVLTFIEYHRSIIEYIGVLNTCTTPTSMVGFGGVPWGPGQRWWTTAGDLLWLEMSITCINLGMGQYLWKYTIFRGMNIHKSQLFWCPPGFFGVLTYTHCLLCWMGRMETRRLKKLVARPNCTAVLHQLHRDSMTAHHKHFVFLAKGILTVLKDFFPFRLVFSKTVIWAVDQTSSSVPILFPAVASRVSQHIHPL